MTSVQAANSDSTVRRLLRDNLPTILGAILTAGAFLGAVALAGGVMAWARFSAIGLPAVDAVSVLPRSQLVVLGALSLLTIAACATLVLVLGQSLGRALLRPGADDPAIEQSDVTTGRDARLLVLVVVLMAAAVVADIVIFELSPWDGVVLVITSAAVCAYLLMLAWGPAPQPSSEGQPVMVVLVEPATVVLTERPLRVPVEDHRLRRRLAGWVGRSSTQRAASALLLFVTALLICAAIVNVVLAGFFHDWRSADAGWLSAAYATAAALSLVIAVTATDAVKQLIARTRGHVAKGSLGQAFSRDPQQHAPDLTGPSTYKLTPGGRAILSAVVLAGIGLAAVLMEVEWVAVTLVAALALVTFLFGHGRSVRSSWAFAATMVGVFLAFGLVASVGKAISDPKMQSVALIRSVGDEKSVYWGLYVAEGNGRVWIAWTAANDRNAVSKDKTELFAVRTDEISEFRLAATSHVNSALGRAASMCEEIARPAVGAASNGCTVDQKPPLRTTLEP